MTVNLKKVGIILVFYIFSASIFAQNDSIDVFVKEQMTKRRVPGLQLAIIKDGVVVKSGNYGIANVQDSVPVNSETLFTINSITKAFTGISIMQLVETGKLDLSAPISKYLSNLPESWNSVTVLQLLSHTSGIPDIIDEEESVLISPFGEEASWEQVVKLPNVFVAGEKFSYNQTNYLLLGRIIDSLSGMSFNEFITKEQLVKANMENTVRAGFGATKEVIAHASGQYCYSKGKLCNTFFSFPRSLQTAAGMSSTATEMANWVIALQNNQLFKDEKSLSTLFTPARLNNGKTAGFSSLLNGYAVGWPVIVREDHPAVAAVGGGRSAVFIYPKDNLSIIVLTNLMGGSPDSFIDEIAGFYIPDMKESNGFGLPTSIKILKAQLDKKGYKNVIKVVAKMKDSKSNLSENELNSWGYKLIKQGRIEDALEIFKLNVYLYPTSENVYDSLAETYAVLEQKEVAIKNYEQVLKLNPNNSNAQNQLQKLKTRE